MYAADRKNPCARGIASCDGAGDRTGADIPGWWGSVGVSESDGAGVGGGAGDMLCVVVYGESRAFIVKADGEERFTFPAEVVDRVCGFL